MEVWNSVFQWVGLTSLIFALVSGVGVYVTGKVIDERKTRTIQELGSQVKESRDRIYSLSSELKLQFRNYPTENSHQFRSMSFGTECSIGFENSSKVLAKINSNLINYEKQDSTNPILTSTLELSTSGSFIDGTLSDLRSASHLVVALPYIPSEAFLTSGIIQLKLNGKTTSLNLKEYPINNNLLRLELPKEWRNQI